MLGGSLVCGEELFEGRGTLVNLGRLKSNRIVFGVGMVLIVGLSLGLRLWGLGRFNTLVFDEVYYANFAADFLQGEQAFGGHPPLSHYLIAFGMWLGEALGFGDAASRNDLTGISLSTISYRWLNAVVGAFFPVLVGAIAHQLTHRPLYSFLAALFAALDGLFLVESRYALNNIYLVMLGLGGYGCLLKALNSLPPDKPDPDEVQAFPDSPIEALAPIHWGVWGWLVLAGVGFGGAIAIKWNGAGFWLGALVLWAIASLGRLMGRLTRVPPPASDHPLSKLSHLNIGHLSVCFAGIPALTYWLSWLPHIALDRSRNFWEWQQQVLSYHQRVGGTDAHPYCSRWLTWLWMQRPVAYFYETVDANQPLPDSLNLTPPAHLDTAIYDVHAMGNPVLWWLASLGILALGVVLARRIWHWFRGEATPSERFQNPSGLHNWTLLFCLVNWGTNWLPWARVSRCTFLYHYMGASVFTLLAIALWVEQGFRSPTAQYRQLSIAAILLIGTAFLFWLPLFLGLPLSPESIQLRRWFTSWV